MVDARGTISGAIRCVGPAGVESDFQTKLLGIQSLTKDIESITGGYAVWGAFEDYPRHQDHAITLMATKCGFVPHLPVRTYLALTLNGLKLDAEWSQIDGESFSHRSGFVISSSSAGAVMSKLDPSVCHPHNFSQTLSAFILMAPKLACSFNFHPSARYKIHCNRPTWTNSDQPTDNQNSS